MKDVIREYCLFFYHLGYRLGHQLKLKFNPRYKEWYLSEKADVLNHDEPLLEFRPLSLKIIK